MAAPEATRVAALLTRLGFDAAGTAADDLTGLWDAAAGRPIDDEAAAVVAAFGRCADPDAAAHALAAITAAATPDGAQALLAGLRDSSTVRARVAGLLGASPALAEHLRRHPAQLDALLGADYDLPELRAASIPALRTAYRRELLAVAGRDLSGEWDLQDVSARLADLAGATLRAALALAWKGLAPGSPPARLAVIAMGKTGGCELNYVSDVDVIFVAEAPDGVDEAAALASATRVAAEMMRICGAAAWVVDAALRPEGRQGALVRTLASHEAYYRRWASTWEFQALLKARPVAGDEDLGRRYVEMITPLVWSAAQRPDFVAEVQAMRRRVVAHVPAAIAAREIKLGPGGLRDVEFAVQLLQLVHGRADDTLRVGGTLAALAALRDGGYVGRDDAVSLGDAYRFLRTAEHRLQLVQLRRTHLVPADEGELTRLARSMGFRSDVRGGPREVWQAEWALHAREVRRLHEKLFYRPLLQAVARVPTEALRLTPGEAGRRLEALGFADPGGALRHIDALTAGLSRRATLQRALLPVMLSELADAPDPDAGLLAYRQVSDRLGSTPWYLRLLRDEGQVATRFARLVGTSRYVANLLGRAPEALQLLAADEALAPRGAAELRASMREVSARQDDPKQAVLAVRAQRRHELLRIAFGDLLGLTDLVTVCEAISATTDATLDAALQVAARALTERRGALPIRFAVIAMGRLGGAEAGYGSDADVVFVYEDVSPEPAGAGATVANELAERLRALLATPSADPPFVVDAKLRPEGANGPLVRSLESYRRYYARWSSPWEAQALLRARFVAGDADLGAQFADLIDPVRYPPEGLAAADVAEIRRIKGRMDAERLPRGADPSTHTKLGRGGLTDIEWTIQLLQLRHGHEVEALRTPRTLAALNAAASAGLLDPDDAGALAAAWRSATAVRNALMLVQDKAGDQLPHQGTTLVGVGRALGYPAGFVPDEVVDDYRRIGRRARRVVERVFYAG